MGLIGHPVTSNEDNHMHTLDTHAPRLFMGLAAAYVLALAPLHALAEDGVTADTIKIGMFGPLTGATSVYGYPINNGAIAIYKDINEKGGINGRKIEIVHEDGACDPAKTRAAVKKLIYTDKVFMIHGGSCSAAVVAARDEFIDSKVPFMVMAATLDAISDPMNKYIFTTTLPGSGDGAVMLSFAKSIPNTRKIAVIRHENDWANAKYKRVQEGYKTAGLDIVADVTLEAKATDATSQVLKVKSANPDATIFILYPGESAVFLRDAEKYGLKGPFIGTTSVMDLKDLQERTGSKTAVKDVYVTAFLKGPIGSPELAKYTDVYKKQFPNDKLQSLSFYGMSGALTVADALRRAGRDLTREKFIEALDATKNGDAGPAYCQVNFSTTRRQGCLDGTIWSLKGDNIVNIGPSWPK
jgi:branched-chain amino acid transport system substrate-binding protein